MFVCLVTLKQSVAPPLVSSRLKPSGDCLSLAPGNYVGSLQVQGQSGILGWISTSTSPLCWSSLCVCKQISVICGVFRGHLLSLCTLASFFILFNKPETSPFFPFLSFFDPIRIEYCEIDFQNIIPWSYEALDGTGLHFQGYFFSFMKDLLCSRYI